MKVSDITAYLIELERSGFTGAVTLNFHKGSVAKNIEKKVKEEVELTTA